MKKGEFLAHSLWPEHTPPGERQQFWAYWKTPVFNQYCWASANAAVLLSSALLLALCAVSAIAGWQPHYRLNAALLAGCFSPVLLAAAYGQYREAGRLGPAARVEAARMPLLHSEVLQMPWRLQCLIRLQRQPARTRAIFEYMLLEEALGSQGSQWIHDVEGDLPEAWFEQVEAEASIIDCEFPEEYWHEVGEYAKALAEHPLPRLHRASGPLPWSGKLGIWYALTLALACIFGPVFYNAAPKSWYLVESVLAICLLTGIHVALTVLYLVNRKHDDAQLGTLSKAEQVSANKLRWGMGFPIVLFGGLTGLLWLLTPFIPDGFFQEGFMMLPFVGMLIAIPITMGWTIYDWIRSGMNQSR